MRNHLTSRIQLTPTALTLLALSAVLLLSATAGAWAESTPLVLLQGDSQILRFNRLQRVAAIDPAVADVIVTSLNELVIMAKGPGRTKIYAWDRTGRHDYALVVKPQEQAQELLRQLRQVLGLQFTYTVLDNRTLLMRGPVASQREQDDIDKVAKDMAKDKSVSLVAVYMREDLAMTPAQRQASILRQILGDRYQYVVWNDNTVMVMGQVPSAPELTQLDNLVKAGNSGGVTVANLVTVGSPEGPAPVTEIAQALGANYHVWPMHGRTVLVEGTAPDAASKERVDKILAAFAANADFVNLVQVAAKPGLPLSEKQKLLADAVGPNLQVRLVGDRALVVEGNVASQPQMDDVQHVVDLFKADTEIVNMVKVVAPELKQVMVKVRVLDLTKNALDQHGFTYGQKALTAAEPSMRTPNYSWIFGMNRDKPPTLLAPVDFVVQALLQDNSARVLAEPNLLVNDGQAANILVGGEVPVPIPSAGGSATTISIEYKQFGVIMDVTPTVLPSGRVQLKVTVEVSDIDPGISVQISGFSVPGFRTRRESTVVDIGSNETFAIGGLLQTTDTKIVTKLPILGDIPILGELFRNTNYQAGQSELAILLAPEVLTGPQATAAGTQESERVKQAAPPLPQKLWPQNK